MLSTILIIALLLFLMLGLALPGAGHAAKELEEDTIEEDDPLLRDDGTSRYREEETSDAMRADHAWVSSRRHHSDDFAKELLIGVLEASRKSLVQTKPPNTHLPRLGTLHIEETRHELSLWRLAPDKPGLVLELLTRHEALAANFWAAGPPPRTPAINAPSHARPTGDALLDRHFSIGGEGALSLYTRRGKRALMQVLRARPVRVEIARGAALTRWHIHALEDIPEFSEIFLAMDTLAQIEPPTSEEALALLERAESATSRENLFIALCELGALRTPAIANQVVDLFEEADELALIADMLFRAPERMGLPGAASARVLEWTLSHDTSRADRESAYEALVGANQPPGEQLVESLILGLSQGHEDARLFNLARLLMIPHEHPRWWDVHVILARLLRQEFVPEFGERSSTSSALVAREAPTWLDRIRDQVPPLLERVEAEHEPLDQDTWETRSTICILKMCARARSPDLQAFIRLTNLTHKAPDVLLPQLGDLLHEHRDITPAHLDILLDTLSTIRTRELPMYVIELVEDPALSSRQRAELMDAIARRGPDGVKKSTYARRLIEELKGSPWRDEFLRKLASNGAPLHRALALAELATRELGEDDLHLFADLVSQTSLSREGLDAALSFLRAWPSLLALDDTLIAKFGAFDVHQKMSCLGLVYQEEREIDTPLLLALLPDPQRGPTIHPRDFDTLWRQTLEYTARREAFADARETILIALLPRTRSITRREIIAEAAKIGSVKSMIAFLTLIDTHDVSEETKRALRVGVDALVERLGHDVLGGLSLTSDGDEGGLTLVEGAQGQLTMLETTHSQESENV